MFLRSFCCPHSNKCFQKLAPSRQTLPCLAQQMEKHVQANMGTSGRKGGAQRKALSQILHGFLPSSLFARLSEHTPDRTPCDCSPPLIYSVNFRALELGFATIRKASHPTHDGPLTRRFEESPGERCVKNTCHFLHAWLVTRMALAAFEKWNAAELAGWRFAFSRSPQMGLSPRGEGAQKVWFALVIE